MLRQQHLYGLASVPDRTARPDTQVPALAQDSPPLALSAQARQPGLVLRQEGGYPAGSFLDVNIDTFGNFGGGKTRVFASVPR